MRLIVIFLFLLSSCAHAGPARQGFASVPGGKIHYRVDGRGEPVVLIHGGFMDLRMWEPQIRALADRYTVIRYDNRGHGQSPASKEPYEPADDLAALLDHVRVDHAHVVGISAGGSFAIDFAILHPERVRSLVLAEPGLGGHRWSDDVIGTMRLVQEALRSGGRSKAIETFLERPVFATAQKNAAAFRAIREQLEANFSLEQKPMKALNPPAKDRLAEIKVPTLVVVSSLGGPDSRVIHDTILERVAGARSVTIDDSGHMMNLEQPAEFNRVVLEFLRVAK